MSPYWQLVRPGVSALVLFAMTVAALTAGEHLPQWPVLFHSLAGTALVMAGALAMNQRLERQSDAEMARTASRPLPTGQLTLRQVAVFGVLASILGTAYLAVMSDVATAAIAASSWVIYVAVYTPLKSVTVWQTPIGATAGAAPMLLGAAAADSLFSPTSAVLLGIVFFWQFPHTMAIAWKQRREYAAAGIKVATVVDPSGRLAGRLAVLGTACLLPVSLAPSMLSLTGWAYAAVAIVSGLVHLAVAASFLKHRSDGSAVRLRRTSLAHLITLLVALLFALRW